MTGITPAPCGPEGLAHALAYAREGWCVLPLHHPIFFASGPGCSCGTVGCSNIGKHPRIAGGCHAASTAPDQIQKWWRRFPNANVGIATGATSNLFVLDIDPRHGGRETLQHLEVQHGPLPPTRRFITGGGGEHVLFSYPPGERLTNSAGRLGPGLDTRGDAGFIVAPPSLHASGGHYRVAGDPTENLTPPPKWLVESLRRQKAEPGSPNPFLDYVLIGAGEGERNHTVASLSGHLLRRYVDPHVVLELVRCWNAARCRPALADEEIVRTVNSICRRELARREAAR